ncbi:hypothetical protein BIFADO_01877 [Bifidobacterium adolescentis L2-32]|uniref:Uncharacterized protein n=1 Tax=Bifidobacterium adolescentis L2-32 TaxID=411481 RepID=A7A7N8_BIFAD|nr:hypothetical protein BIFADO_01877 [Bifidobacterium adolescentis L2-32]
MRHVVFVALVALNEARQSDHSAVPAQRKMIESRPPNYEGQKSSSTAHLRR